MRIAAYLQQFDSDEDDGGDHSEFAEEEHEVSDGVDGYDSQCYRPEVQNINYNTLFHFLMMLASYHGPTSDRNLAITFMK